MHNRLCLASIVLLAACIFMCACKEKTATSRWVDIEKEGVRRGDEALLKYKNADYPTAKAALVDLLGFLDKASYPPNAPDEFRADAMLTCARLAKLEEKQGHAAEMDSYMEQAVIRCQAGRLQPAGGCSREYVRNLVDKMDAMLK